MSNTTLAQLKDQILTGTLDQIKRHVAEGKLNVPQNYSDVNAIQSAWLILQDTKGSNNAPVLTSCTVPSIVNALRTMVIQGLDPTKKHCYFIGYGNSLQCQRSYFGDMMLAQRSKPGIEFYYSVVRDGDEFEVEIIRGKKFVASHKTKFANADNAIIGAYCGVTDADGTDLGATVMTAKDIKQSWQQSKTYKEGGNGTHQKFEEEMTLRTVIRKCCKPIINSSNDELLMAAVAESERDYIDAELAEEVDQYGNGEVLTIEEAEAVEITEDSETPQSTEEAVASEAKPW